MLQAIVVEKIKTHIFLFNNSLFPENLAVFEILWKNAVESDGLQRTIRRMRFAYWLLRLQTHTQNM